MPCSAVSGPRWNEAYLIGGGPSLCGYDLSPLRGRTVVAVNDAMLQLPWATAVVTVDSRWIENRRRELESFAGEKYLILAPERQIDVPGATRLRMITYRGLSDDPEVCHVRGNSGYAALNVAYLKGAKKIWLLGYDFCHSRVHWFPEYQWKSGASDALYVRWALEFDYTIAQLKRAQVEVINVGTDSQIRSYPKMSLEDFRKVMETSNGLDIQR